MHKEPIHPTARKVLHLQDQTNWAVTKDGLICAPVGFYRVLEQYGEDADSAAKTVAFAFNAEDLDLVDHPADPNRKILKNPTYVLEPLSALEAEMPDALQRKMEDHQSAWQLFQAHYGNLYYTDRREEKQGEYFSNDFIAYRIFPEFDAKGNVIKHHVSYRVDPYNKKSGFGLDQGEPSTLWRSFAKHGIELENFATRDETLRFIHEDYCKRFERFVPHKEVQDWRDPDIVGNVGMWLTNNATHLANQPFSLGSAASKLAELLIKLSPAGIMFGVWIDRVEKRAEQEREDARGGELKNIADIEGEPDPRIPLYMMKEEALPHWVALSNPQPPLLRAALPLCEDMEEYKRKRMVDIISGYYPVIVRQYVCEASKDTFIMAREHHGMQILIVDEGSDPANPCTKRYITYAECRGATKQPGLPANLKPLFSDDEGTIACIEKRHVTIPLAAGETLFHKPPHDTTHHYVHYFVKMEDVTAGLSEQLVTALRRHRKPKFLHPKHKRTANVPETLSGFRRAQEVVCRYAAAALPTTTEKLKSCARIYPLFALAAVAAFAPMGHLITADVKGSVPLLFTAAAALLTKHMGKSCPTPRGTTRFNVVASAILSCGLLTFAYRTGMDVEATCSRNGFNETGLLNSCSDPDIYEKVAGTMGALALGLPSAISTLRVGLRAFGKKASEIRSMHAPRGTAHGPS